MPIQQLSINNLRNIVSASIAPNPHINLLYGDNASGKTSVLEAIHLLGLARSFQSARTKTIVRCGQEQMTLFVRLANGLSIGLSRDDSGHAQVKIGDESIRSVSALAELLPVQMIDADSFRLLNGSPVYRRQFLDWGVFHVEPKFYPEWQRAQQGLRQRNICLKAGRVTDSQRVAWEQQWCESAHKIDQYRAEYLQLLVEHFHQALDRLGVQQEVRIHYQRGWDKRLPLQQVLADHLPADLKAGFTRVGPQRADICIKQQGEEIVNLYSRGQQKMIVCALKLAQGMLLQQQQRKPLIYLIDDIEAELDRQHVRALCDLLQGMQAQVFITSIEAAFITELWADSQHRQQLSVFHVEQGQVQPIM